jgi:hypothetical protein
MDINQILIIFGSIGFICSGVVIGPAIAVLTITYGFTGKISPGLVTLFGMIITADLFFVTAIFIGRRNRLRR